MVKTTVHLPDALKRALAAVSESEGKSEAELIREAIQHRVDRPARRAPTLPDDGFGR